MKYDFNIIESCVGGYNNLEFREHEIVNQKIEELSSEFEKLKNSFPKDVTVDKLISSHKDINGYETAKRLDNVLMLGVKVGIELSTYLQKINLK